MDLETVTYANISTYNGHRTSSIIQAKTLQNFDSAFYSFVNVSHWQSRQHRKLQHIFRENLKNKTFLPTD